MVICHLEKTKKNGASVCFGKARLITSCNIFFRSVLTSMDDSHAPPLAAVEEDTKILCNEEKLNDMRGDAKIRRTPLSCNESGSV